MLKEEKEYAIDASALAESYERWLKAYQQHDASRRVVLDHHSFGAGVISTIQLFPHHGRHRFHFRSRHHSVSSAIFHDWFSVGGDLWGAYLADTIDVHGDAGPSEDTEPAGDIRRSSR